MPVDTEHGTILVSNLCPLVIRRDTNTVVIELRDDEVMTLIADLASNGHRGGPVYLVLEQDEITYPRDVNTLTKSEATEESDGR